jgi:unsaturated chondroitin disaccharide hydrolase
MLNLNEMKELVLQKTKRNIRTFGDKLPTHTENGKYIFAENGFWVGGFWAGLALRCYELSGDQLYLEGARASRGRFAKRLYENPKTLDHDTGLLYLPSCVADYKLTGNEEAKQMALDAAAVLAGRFNEAGRFIQAWNVRDPEDPFSRENQGRMIIDCMFNIPLLFWAAEATGDQNYRRIAIAHADTCAKYIIRPDYTTFHSYVFDPETGAPKYGRTVQGYADDSCWARGQAWAVGGFTHAYAHTGKREYLNIAINCAQVFIKNLEADHIPRWDLSLLHNEGEPRDTSAAAMTAASLLELSKYVEGEEKKYCLDWSVKILESLYMNYSTKDLPEEEGLLLHACQHKPKNINIDCALIYGDYFFAEAIAGLLNKTIRYW